MRKHRRFLHLPLARGPPMLPPVTLPAVRHSVTHGRGWRAGDAGPGRVRCLVRRDGSGGGSAFPAAPGGPAAGRAGGTARRKGPVRDAESGLAEVMSVPAIWRDAAGRLLELPGPGSG